MIPLSLATSRSPLTVSLRSKNSEWLHNAGREIVAEREDHLKGAAARVNTFTVEINNPTSLLSNHSLSPETRGKRNPSEALYEGQPLRKQSRERGKD